MVKPIVEYLYESTDVLKIIIYIRQGFFETIGYLGFSILMLPAGVFISSVLVIGIFKGVLFQLSTKDILLFLFFATFADYIGCMTLYQWLRYNFGREIIILNNKDKYLRYQQLVIGLGKIREFYYSNISRIVAEREWGRYPDYFCWLQYKQKKFKFGIVNDIMEGTKIIDTIANFIVM